MVRRARRWVAAVTACVPLGLALAGCAGAPSPGATLGQYTRDWDHRDWAAMEQLVSHPPSDFVAFNRGVLSDLRATGISVTYGSPRVQGDVARADLVEHVTVAGLGRDLVLHSTSVLHLVNGTWSVEWTPGTIDGRLGPGDHFAVSTVWAPRAGIDGSSGPLFTTVQQVDVGVVGQRLKDPAAVGALLQQAGAPPDQVNRALSLAQSHPTLFEPVFTVSAQDYADRIRPSPLYAVAGTQFEPSARSQAASADLGTYVLGGVGPVTAQDLSRLGPLYAAGDLVGQGGLEEEYEHQLAGVPGEAVEIVTGAGRVVATLARTAPRPGTPLQTSISLPVQQAADAAVAGSTVPAALVAVRASTGEVLAVANHVPSGAPLDYALEATEAPGSTFKVVTSTALIEKGLGPQSPATCPATVTVDGERFHNDEGEASGPISLLTAFAQSCNTAFIGLAADHLAPSDLVSAAAGYRIGTTPQMGYPAYGGRVPTPTDQADLASTAIGQGQVTVSPLDLAMVAAAVDSGTVRAPRLVTGAPDDRIPASPVEPTVDSDLHGMMMQVVDTGTAAGAGLPPGTYGKTGTAEFGSARPPLTHAWFMGFNGDIAFAVFVDTGTSGGAVAAPLAARFLDALSTHG